MNENIFIDRYLNMLRNTGDDYYFTVIYETGPLSIRIVLST